MVIDDLLERNRKWAAERTAEDPGFFARVAAEHKPRAFYIGCSDARVPANILTGTDVGELFVHRNVANQVHATDASLSAGLQYAIEALGVTEVIVVGHHQCGGVRAALAAPHAPSHVEAWISPLRMLARLHRSELEGLDADAQADKLVALNVIEQVRTLSRHPSVRQAWEEGRELRIHGVVFALEVGRLVPVIEVDGPEYWQFGAGTEVATAK